MKNKKNNSETLGYTILEVSKILDVSTRTIHSYIKKNKLTTIKHNNKLYFPKEQFIHQDQEYLFNQKEEPTKEKQGEGQETDGLIKELRDKIKSLEEDKLYFKEQIRIEQSLRRDDIEKISKVLQLNYLPKEEEKQNNIYEAQPIEPNTNQKTSKKQHNRTRQPTNKTSKQKQNTNKTTKDLKSYSKNDKIEGSKHKKGFFGRLFKG